MRRRRSPSRGGVLGMDPGGVLAAAAHQQRRVVHPGVVRAQLAQADQAQREVGVVRRCGRRGARPRRRSRARRGGRGGRGGAPSCASPRPRGARRARSRAGSRRSFLTLSPPRRSPKRSPLGPVRSSRSTSRSGVDEPDAGRGRRAGAPRRDAEGTTPIRFEISSIISHSWRASPAGSTTGSVMLMKGVVKRLRNGSGKSSRSYIVVAGST